MAWRSRREGTAPVRWPTAKRRNRRPTQPPTDRAGGRNHWRCLRLAPHPHHPYKPADSFSPPPTSEEAAMRRTPIRGSRAVCGGEGADGGGAVRLVGEGQGRLAGQQEDDEPEGQNGSGKITAWGCDVFGGHPGSSDGELLGGERDAVGRRVFGGAEPSAGGDGDDHGEGGDDEEGEVVQDDAVGCGVQEEGAVVGGVEGGVGDGGDQDAATGGVVEPADQDP